MDINTYRRLESWFFAFISVHPTIDPSAALRTTARAGPNGADRVLVDNERRVIEIFLERA